MPKSPTKTIRLTSNLIDLLKINIFVPEKLTDEDIRMLLHDLRSSANAFSMMVEDLGMDLQNSGSSRQRTKFHQLQEHVISTEKVIEKICDAIARERKQSNGESRS
jgi:hypothetical protein